MVAAVLETHVEGIPCTRGKVRDVYTVDRGLVLVATDRISAFDWILPNGVPDKGTLLTGLSAFWFAWLRVPHHLLSVSLETIGRPFSSDPETFAGRSVLARRARVIPFECVARGYLAGSGWKEYRAGGQVCGHRLPSGLRESDRLPEPIFTPATKAAPGEHDENISPTELANRIGTELAGELERRTLSLYQRAAEKAESCGILLADTKFEFGHTDHGELILIDEVLTPDSSRFWPAERYQPGGPVESFDKQFVRDWLESVGFDKQSQPPPMPDEIIARTRDKYIEAFTRLTGRTLEDYAKQVRTGLANPFEFDI